MDRRSIIKAAGAGIATGVLGGVSGGRGEAQAEALAFENSSFYGADGEFDVEKGKDAIIALMEYHGYPVFEGVREKLWVSDYGLGRFTELGLAANMFINEPEGAYMVMDLFLLPNQMLPEHWHEDTGDKPPKMEGWVVRHGLSYAYGEGPPPLDMHAVIPDFERDHVSVYYETIMRPGETGKLKRPTARHWQLAGPEGAILTEAARYHDDAAVRHSDPNIVFP